MATERRYKSREELSAEEEFEFQRTRILPERDEYKQLRRATLEAAGLESDTDAERKPVSEMTPQDHLLRIQARQ